MMAIELNPFFRSVPCWQQGETSQQQEQQWLTYLIAHPEFDAALTAAQYVDSRNITFHRSILDRVLQAQIELGWIVEEPCTT